MADTKEVILNIKTNFGDSIDQLAKLQKEMDELKVAQLQVNAAVKDGTKTREEADKELEAIGAQMRNVRQQMNGYRKDIDNEIKSHQENEGSIKQMRLELSKMRKEYESMSAKDRNSDAGKALLQNISNTTEELKGLEQAQGDWRREVGHYQNALENLDPTLARVMQGFKAASGGTMDMGVAMKNAGATVKTFGKQLLKLAANPIVALIMAIVTVVKSLVDQFKKSDEAMTALDQAFAALQPFIDMFKSTLSVIIMLITKVIEGFTSMVTAIMSLVPAFAASSEAAQQWVLEMDALEEKERQYTVERAKNDVKIARLRNVAAQADKYSIEERKKAMEDAVEIEKQNLRMELEVAKKKWELAKEDAERQQDTSDETMNNIANLEAAYYQAIANTESGMRRLYSQLSTFNKQLEKEAIDTSKRIMANSKATTAERMKAAKDLYQQEVESARKTADEAKKYYYAVVQDPNAIDYDDPDSNRPNYKKAKEDWDAAEKVYQKAMEDYKEAFGSMNDDLASIAADYRSKETAAQRAYEDAILESMDETLDKQLQLVEKEYNREIEDLREKLRTEEHLTKKARDYINKLIIEKESKLQETLILTQAKYWAEVRESARDTLNEIAAMNAKLNAADPGRVAGSFAASVRDAMQQANDEFKAASDKLTKDYAVQYNAMTQVISQSLSKNKKNLESSLRAEGTIMEEWAEKPKILADNVVYMMQAMRDGSEEFAGGATENLETFMKAVSSMRKRIGMTEDEFNQLFEELRPYLSNINEYYQTLTDMPSKFTKYMGDLIYNQMKNDSERIQKVMMENISFEGLFPDAKKKIEDEIKEIDKFLRLNLSDSLNPLEIGSIKINKDELEQALAQGKDIREIIEEYGKNMEFEFTWRYDWSMDEQAMDDLERMAETYGNKFNSTFSGVLATFSGSDDIEEQIGWLVHNYEKAVEKVENINKDFQRAFEIYGDDVFLDAMIDESTILPQLRRIYDLAKAYGDDQLYWENARLEIQGRYVGDANRELKIKSDMLALENQRLLTSKKSAENQLNYLNDVRDDVRALENTYNSLNMKNTAQIKILEEQLQSLNSEAKTFNEGTNPEVVDQNRQIAADIQHKIDFLKSQTEKALKKLAETGFMSTEELDKVVNELTNQVLSANNQIVENTAQQASTVTQMWLNSFTTVSSSLSTLTGAFNSMFTEMGETSERWNAFAEATAYMTIGINMAQGIAEAVAAGSGVPFPANIAAISSGIAAVVSAIGSAFSVYNQYHSQPKFAEGGLIGGRYASSRSEGRRDDVQIRASRGEYIINADAVKQYGVAMFDLLNFGKKKIKYTPKFAFADGGLITQTAIKSGNSQFQMDAMKEMMAEVMNEVRPVVSVREISNVQNRVRVKESIARK